MDRVVVKQIETESKTAAGLYIPDTAKDKSMEGVIKAVGEGRYSESGQLIPMSVKVDDKVLFSNYAGTKVKINGEEFLVMKEADLLLVLED